MKIKSSTRNYIGRKEIDRAALAVVLNCIEAHVDDLLSGRVTPDFRERAILRMCANIRPDRLAKILGDAHNSHEWRPIPGFSKYEASSAGEVRRRADGHGSMPGKILKPWPTKAGHLRINLSSDDGIIKCKFIHTAVCLAFHGERPSPKHGVCHKDDIKSNNTPDNLYWGTDQDNALDRVRNGLTRKSVTPQAHTKKDDRPISGRALKKVYKLQMLERLSKMAK